MSYRSSVNEQIVKIQILTKGMLITILRLQYEPLHVENN